MKAPAGSWGPHIQLRIIEELDEATLSLALAHRSPIHSVHDCRRRIKRARAALRILRPADPKTLQREDLVLADAARRLGPVRDGHVAFLRKPDIALPPPYSHQIRQLIVATTVLLNSSASRAARWDVTGVTAQTIESELADVYKKAWRRWQDASATIASCTGESCVCEGCLGDDWVGYDHFHDARKSVKRLHYQLAILDDIGFFRQKEYGKTKHGKNASPTKLKHHRQIFVQLGDRLGDHHDLTISAGIDLAEKARIESDLLDLGLKAFARKPKKHRSWMATQIR